MFSDFNPLVLACNFFFFGIDAHFSVTVSVFIAAVLIFPAVVKLRSSSRSTADRTAIMTSTPSSAGSGVPAQAAAAINKMIQSGDFAVWFSALKGFRNGAVYGAKVRAPHALVLNLVWSKAPYSAMPAKIWRVTKEHAVHLGGGAALYAALTKALAAATQGQQKPWHVALAGFLVGFTFWGNMNSTVQIQMMMYMLSRCICALYHTWAKYRKYEAPPIAFRVYSGVLWAVILTLFVYQPDTMQPSMRQSMTYIYNDCFKFSNWRDLLFVNKN